MTKQQQQGRKAGSEEDSRADEGPSVVAATDDSVGGIGFDELGQPRWTWITEHDGSARLTNDDTFDYLKALDNDSLTLQDDPDTAPDGQKLSKQSGYDPYDTARIDVRGRFGRR
jgi:hypothetical protein